MNPNKPYKLKSSYTIKKCDYVFLNMRWRRCTIKEIHNKHYSLELLNGQKWYISKDMVHRFRFVVYPK